MDGKSKPNFESHGPDTISAAIRDLELAATVQDAVVRNPLTEQAADNVRTLRDVLAELVTLREAEKRRATDVVAYLDHAITTWRAVREKAMDDAGRLRAVHYVDAFQSARKTLVGSLLADGHEDDPVHLFDPDTGKRLAPAQAVVPDSPPAPPPVADSRQLRHALETTAAYRSMLDQSLALNEALHRQFVQCGEATVSEST